MVNKNVIRFFVTGLFKSSTLFALTSFCVLTLFSSALAADPDDDSYLIGKGDILDISVWQTPDLTKVLTVSFQGKINFPFLGDIDVMGKTLKQVSNLLVERLSQGYVKDPQVSVSLKECNSKKILVFGEVVQPGLYRLKAPIPLLESFFLVGGVRPEAKRLTIIRPFNADGQPRPTLPDAKPVSADTSGAKAIEVDLIALLAKGDLSQNVIVQPGDTIYVSSGTGEKFYVLGQVKKPGPYEWIPDVTVLAAIKMADGATTGAALNRIQIRRKTVSGEEDLIRVNIVDIMKGKKKDDIVVKPGDVIVIPESWI